MDYVDVEYVIALHTSLIEETGGDDGLRDRHLLLSSIERPKQQFGGTELYPDVFRKAAVYLESLAQYHVFIDGNKRTAIATAAYFLHLNRYELKATNRDLENFVLKVVEKKPDLNVIAAWLRQHSRHT